MKTAIFGGSFNPVHNGHINLVREAIINACLDRVIIMPAFISPFKKNECPPADGIHRLEMLRLAFKDMKDIFISDYELKRAEVSYTVNTMRHFRETYPDDELYFIMGGDMLSSLHMWYKFEDIMSLCGIIAAVITTTLITKFSFHPLYTSVTIAALVSSFTIGGKALGKTFAIKNSNQIVYQVALLLCVFKKERQK